MSGLAESDVIEHDMLYAVLWSEDGHRWRVVTDEVKDGEVPAVFQYEAMATRRRNVMAEMFPECHYKVGVYELGRS